MSKDTKLHILILATLSFIISIAYMPAQFYAGDSYAIKLISNNLIDNGDIGIDYSKRESLTDFLTNKDQYFFENDNEQKFYQRWGVLNPIFFAIPDILSTTPLGLDISKEQIKRHGIFNAFLSSVLVVTIFLICGIFSKSNIHNSIYCLIAVYGSFIWHYTLAQSYEIIQLVLFNLALLFTFKYKTSKNKNNRIAFNIVLVLLIFTKSVYFIFIPLFILFLEDFKFKGLHKKVIKYLPELVIYSCCVLFFIYLQNTFFQESFPERTAHPHDLTKVDFAIAHIPYRFKEYFLSLNKNIILYVPALIFSLFGWSDFFRTYKDHATLILLSFAILTPIVLSFHIYGDWCFGPRYYIALFPSLSLGLLFTLKRKSTIRIFMVMTFLVFTTFQLIFIQRKFHFNYIVKEHVRAAKVETKYFMKHPLLQSLDLLRSNENHPLLNELVQKQVSGIKYSKIEKELNIAKCKLLHKNLCF